MVFTKKKAFDEDIGNNTLKEADRKRTFSLVLLASRDSFHSCLQI